MIKLERHNVSFCWCMMQGLESDGTAAWNSFDLSSYLAADQYLTDIEIVIKGTDGAPGFSMIDLRVLGAVTDNPTDTVYVSTAGFVRGRSVGVCFRSIAVPQIKRGYYAT